MTDVTAGQSSGFSIPGIGSLNDLSKRGDIALAIGVITILVVLILPLPPVLLDFALAISIIFSVLILMTALFIHTPLEFSAFPTVLLIATMLRLALNLASTRLILAHGHEGTDGRRPRDRGVRQFRDERQLRDRHHRVHDPGDRELRGDHQGLRPHRRSRGALQPRRHAGQADGDRRRSLGRADQRERRAHAAQAPGGRERVLRRDGRRLQVRARRRHRRPAGRVHQRDRRHDHRHRAAGHAVRRSRRAPTRCSPSATDWSPRSRR